MEVSGRLIKVNFEGNNKSHEIKFWSCRVERTQSFPHYKDYAFKGLIKEWWDVRFS